MPEENPQSAITDQDRAAFQSVVSLPGFFTLPGERQRKAIRSVGPMSKLADGQIDRVIGSLKRIVDPAVQKDPSLVAHPPMLTGEVKPVSSGILSTPLST